MRAPDFWRRDGVVARALSPASCIWRAVARRRRRVAKPVRTGVPVICIGNAVAGGAGKTPVALSIAARLIRHGKEPHFLSRGYGGTERGPLQVDPDRHAAAEVGDEPLLLGRLAPAWIARDRVAGAKAAAAQGAGLVIMDDGFQNHDLQKDLSILVFDGGYGIGNGRLMPAGPLREPLEDALARADAVIVIGDDRSGIRDAVAGRRPLLWARHVPVADTDGISGKRVVAFAGIGRPGKFFETLAGMGCHVIATRDFPDHHAYSPDEIMSLIDTAAAANALLVTTEKDAVRLPPAARDMVKVLRVVLEWQDDDALDKLLEPVITVKA